MPLFGLFEVAKDGTRTLVAKGSITKLNKWARECHLVFKRDTSSMFGGFFVERSSGLAFVPDILWQTKRRRNPDEIRTSIDQSLLSPSGRMSKAARARALKRVAAELFPPGYWDFRKERPPTDAEHRASLLHAAAELRGLAARGMQPRKHLKAAQKLEDEARGL